VLILRLAFEFRSKFFQLALLLFTDQTHFRDDVGKSLDALILGDEVDRVLPKPLNR